MATETAGCIRRRVESSITSLNIFFITFDRWERERERQRERKKERNGPSWVGRSVSCFLLVFGGSDWVEYDMGWRAHRKLIWYSTRRLTSWAFLPIGLHLTLLRFSSWYVFYLYLYPPPVCTVMLPFHLAIQTHLLIYHHFLYRPCHGGQDFLSCLSRLSFSSFLFYIDISIYLYLYMCACRNNYISVYRFSLAFSRTFRSFNPNSWMVLVVCLVFFFFFFATLSVLIVPSFTG